MTVDHGAHPIHTDHDHQDQGRDRAQDEQGAALPATRAQAGVVGVHQAGHQLAPAANEVIRV